MTASKPDKTNIGQVLLGRYRVVRSLARGGMGAVFLARNEGAAGFVRPVVIKTSLVRGERPSVDLFAREARILSNLSHPNVVSIVDFAEQDGEYIMVLDYVHGYTLAQWARFTRRRGGQLPVDLSVFAIREVLGALDYAHRLRDSGGAPLGIVHRDVKPSNVLVDVQGLLKLADFGIARTNTEITDTSTGDVTLKGTFAYMAPELFTGAAPSPRSDVYSAAVTLYHLIAGVNPFTTNDAALTAARAIRHNPPPLDQLRGDVPGPLAAVVARGMAKAPGVRFATAAELSGALTSSYPAISAVGRSFAAAVERDFHDPELPRLLGLDSLAERERAWKDFDEREGVTDRTALPLSPSQLENAALLRGLAGPEPESADGDRASAEEVAGPAPHPPPDQHTAETVILPVRRARPPEAEATLAPDEHAAQSTAATSARRTRLVLAALLAIAGIGVGAGVYFSTRPGDDREGATVLMVRGDVEMSADASPSGRPPPTAPAAPTPEPSEPGTEPAGEPANSAPRPAAKESPASALTNRFRKRRAKLARCFELHGPSAQRLSVRFEVDVRGAVTKAELIPASAMATPLGRCLLQIAESTRFGPQRASIAFRIPIDAAPR